MKLGREPQEEARQNVVQGGLGTPRQPPAAGAGLDQACLTTVRVREQRCVKVQAAVRSPQCAVTECVPWMSSL